jgi:hypothetical protein
MAVATLAVAAALAMQAIGRPAIGFVADRL